MPKSAAERQKAYYERRKAHNMKRVNVWIPGDAQDEFNELVEKLQEKWIMEGRFI